MTQDELQEIIDTLERLSLKDKATFGIFQYSGRSDESYIRADKEGLKLFALELLKAVGKSGDTLNNKETSIIPIIFEESWVDEQSDTVIQYIEPIAERRVVKDETKFRKTIVDKLLPFGCIVVLMILVVAILVGLWTLIKWFT